MTPLVICAYCKAEIPPVLGNAVDVGLGLMHRPCAAAYEIDESNRMYVLLQRAEKYKAEQRSRLKSQRLPCAEPGCRQPRAPRQSYCVEHDRQRKREWYARKHSAAARNGARP
jgi:hypothetical protein